MCGFVDMFGRYPFEGIRAMLYTFCSKWVRTSLYKRTKLGQERREAAQSWATRSAVHWFFRGRNAVFGALRRTFLFFTAIGGFEI